MSGARKQIRIAVLLLALCTAAMGHRLDLYLQATRIFLFQDHLEIQLYLTPGVNVANTVFSAIDLDHNGLISPEEQRAYSKRLLDHLVLRLDERIQPLRLASMSFASRADMEEGVGVVWLKLTAPAPVRSAHHHLYFENDNDPGMSLYLMNVMVPNDKDIRIVRQDRDFLQTRYTVDYETGSRGIDALRTASAVYVAFGFGLCLCGGAFLRRYYRTGLMRSRRMATLHEGPERSEAG